MPRRIAIAEAKARFAEFVRRAEAGESVVLTRHGRPVARLVPAAGATAVAEPGSPAGEVAEAPSAYEARRPADSGGAAPRSKASRRRALEGLLRERVWPRVPEGQLGVGVDKREREEILGYGSDGA